jgi:hypothetical protein
VRGVAVFDLLNVVPLLAFFIFLLFKCVAAAERAPAALARAHSSYPCALLARRLPRMCHLYQVLSAGQSLVFTTYFCTPRRAAPRRPAPPRAA